MITTLQQTTTITASTGSAAVDWAYDLGKILAGGILGYLLGRLSAKKSVEDQFKQKHFNSMNAEVVKPMIEACGRLKDRIFKVVVDPERGLHLNAAEPTSPLYGRMKDHFPDLMREWNALLQDTERLHLLPRALWKTSERGRPSPCEHQVRGELLHYINSDWKWNLYRIIASCKDGFELVDGDFRIRETLVMQFKDLYELNVNKFGTLIFHAQGSHAEMESCKLALIDIQSKIRTEIDDLFSRRDKLSEVCLKLGHELTDITYRKTLPGKCDLCQ